MGVRISRADLKRLCPDLELPEETKPSKYRNQKTTYNGVEYDSKLEAERAAAIDAIPNLLLRYDHPRFRLGIHENVYEADFLVILTTGFHVEDTKGHETPKFKRDKKLWVAYGPCDLWLIRRGAVEPEILKGGRAR